MRKKRTTLIVGFAVTVGCAVAGWIAFHNHNATRLEKTEAPSANVNGPSYSKELPAPAQPFPIPETTPSPPVSQSVSSEPSVPMGGQAPSGARPASQPPQATAQAQPSNQPKRKLQDPVARDALAYVGVDPDAEQYWAAAIFDTSLPNEERDDLMEDLNEVGFPDPKHPGPEDVPLIVNRLRIIDEVVPYADDFMLPHLAEAYKDLVGMYYGQAPE